MTVLTALAHFTDPARLAAVPPPVPPVEIVSGAGAPPRRRGGRHHHFWHPTASLTSPTPITDTATTATTDHDKGA